MPSSKEVADDILAHPLTPEEIAERQRPIGRLQLRADAPTIEIDGNTPALDVLARLDDGEELVALVGRESGTAAVAIPVEQYLALVSNLFNLDPPMGEPNFAHARKETLPGLHVEEVNPHNLDAPPSFPDDTSH